LTAHLISIVQNANVNKMTMRNVGIVFCPMLGIPAGVFSLMLGEFNRVFNANDVAHEAESAEVEESSTMLWVSNAGGTDVYQGDSPKSTTLSQFNLVSEPPGNYFRP
jgi:hypothetical protein